MKLDAHLWNDSSMVGIVNTAFVGKSKGTSVRWVNNKKKEVPSFCAQRIHAITYGGVDRIGKGAKEYGVNFNIVPWHRHIIKGIENINSHATWGLAQYDMEVCKDKDMLRLLKPYRATRSEKGSVSTSKGCTSKRKFLLEMSSDVIQRCRDSIKEKGSKSLSPKRMVQVTPSKTMPNKTPPGQKGRPRMHKFFPNKHDASRPCLLCYSKKSEANKALPEKDRLCREELRRKTRYCFSGCNVCVKRMCQVCWMDAHQIN